MKRLLALLALLFIVGCAPITRLIATPTPSALAAATSWLEEIQPYLDTEAQAVHTMTALLDYPELGDSVWVGLASTQMTKYREADSALRGIIPPEECREIHELLLSASGDGLLGMEFLVSGVLQKESSRLRASMDFLDSASTKLELAKLLTDDIAP